MGVQLGDHLMPPFEGNNPKGFWEDIDINALNIEMMSAVHSDWHYLTPLRDRDVEALLNAGFSQRAEELLRNKVGASPLFGIKDPRIAKLLPFWKIVFDRCQYDTSYILAVRHPLSVVQSLSKRDALDSERSYLLWLEHYLISLHGIENQNCVFVDYDRLIQDPKREIKRIAAGLELTIDPVALQDFIDEFLDESLRHTVYSLDDLTQDGACPPLVREIYPELLGIASEGSRQGADALGQKMAQWLTEFLRSTPALDLADKLTRELAKLNGQMCDREQALIERDTQIGRLNDKITQLTQQISEQDGNILALQTKLRYERMTLDFAIETPKNWATLENPFLISGWAHRTGEVNGIRARIGGREFVGEWVQPDTDPHETTIGHAGAERTGFQILARGMPGEQEIELEFLAPNGSWNKFYTRSATFPLHPMKAAMDTPADLKVTTGQIRFSGWSIHPQMAIHDLVLLAGEHRFNCQSGLQRDDVAQAFPGWPGAENTGFECFTHLPPGKFELRLEAHLEDRSVVRFDLEKILLVESLPILVRLKAVIGRYISGNAIRFARFSFSRGIKWIKDKKRLPHPGEIYRLYRKARVAYQHAKRQEQAGLGLPDGFVMARQEDPYQKWIDLNRFSENDAEQLRHRLECAQGILPRIAVVMPVYAPPREFFEMAVGSVRTQIYDNWQLCMADDASPEPWVRPRLAELAKEDDRIRVAFRETNGNISLASNSAAEITTADFLLFLDQDDLLTPDALGEVALHLSKNPDVDVIYSDDDKIDSQGNRLSPQFKPDWSPELLLSYMYFSHVFAVRRTLFNEVGGFRVGFEGSQDYDLALRVTERARKVAHLPYVLYHWRVLPGSTASSGNAKPESFEAGRRAVSEALSRRGGNADVYRPAWAVDSGIGLFWHDFPNDGPSVSILIPTKNQRPLLQRCIESINKSTYKNYEVIVIDNESDDADTLKYLASLKHRVLRIPNQDGRFSFAGINNAAARESNSDFLLFLNNDTEVREPKWLSRMVGYAQLQGVGAVGARLLYPDGRVQHAGVVHGYYDGMAGPAFKLQPTWSHGYLSYAMVTRNYSAVTAACLLTPRTLFLELEGFDEKRFAVAYNDVDYCYRLVDKGYRCVYAPGAELIHYEGLSRGFRDNPAEILAFRQAYAGRKEPYYNPNLSLENESFEILPVRIARNNSDGPVPALMCAFNLNWEGAPYSQYEMTLALYRRGIIKPIVYSPFDGPLRLAYEKEGIEVIVKNHPLTDIYELADYEKAISEFADWIRELKVSVVYGNTLHTFYAIAAAKALNLPSLWNVRESEPWQTFFDFLPPALAAKALGCFQYPYRIIFVANATRDAFEALNSEHNFCVVHNGLNLDRLTEERAGQPRHRARAELNIAQDEIVLLLLGTVCARKGQQDLARAVALLPAEVAAKLRFYIVGDRHGAYSTELHQLAETLPQDRKNRLEIVPETDNTAHYYSAADIFLCTSVVESYPRVILEAMAYDLAIITTPVFGIVEQVKEGINGEFYTPGNAAELAGKIAKLATDRHLIEQYRSAAHPVLHSLTGFDEMAGKYAEHFRAAASIR